LSSATEDGSEARDGDRLAELAVGLATARRLILSAGRLVHRAWMDEEGLRVDQKGLYDFVTQVDHRSEALIAAGIAESFPDDGFLGEEGSSRDLERARVWIVDPLDGTSNFIHRYPAFAVSIALTRRRTLPDGDPRARAGRLSGEDRRARFPAVLDLEPVLGLIYDVCQQRLFWAIQGGGAWVEDLRSALDEETEPAMGADPLTSAEGSSPERWLGALVRRSRGLGGGAACALKEAFLATGFPVRYRDLARLYQEAFERLLPGAAGLRRGGSAALDLAYTAAGIFDGFFEIHLSPWDVAAGILLVEEAGGRVSGLGGDPLADGNLLAGPPELVRELEAALEPVFRADSDAPAWSG